MSFPIILLLSILILAIVYILTGYVFAQLTLNPKRQPIETTPAEYGMAYEDIEFQSTDGLTIKGWFIPKDPRKVLLLTHPMYCNRHGFLVRNKSPLMLAANTNIDFLLAVKAFNEAGYSVLTIDFRNHGESEDGLTGVGLNEYQDILGALRYLREKRGLENADLGLISFCMGANSTIVAMSKAPEQFSNARCLVAIQPISMAVFVRSYIKSIFTRLGMVILPMTNSLRQLLGGYPLEEMSPRSYVKDIKLPTLYIQSRNDSWTEMPDILSFYEDTTAPKEFHWLETTQHRLEAYQHVSENPQPIIDFINAHLQDSA
jgi:alpha-beta hydrolase superfamily lysophospholipase